MLNNLPQEEEKKKFPLKRLLIIIAIIIFTAAVTFFVVWWQLTKVINSQKEEISYLEEQINLLSEKVRNYPNDQ